MLRPSEGQRALVQTREVARQKKCADHLRQIRMIISRGRPQKLLAVVKYAAPEWFLAMDQNRDGDISRREFIGDGVAFQRLDRSGDLLISPDEIHKR